MENYKDVISRVNIIVNEYSKSAGLDGNTLNMQLKNITSLLYYLETVRAEIHDKWQIQVNKYINEGKSVARSENIAHVKHPQMYELRRVMTSGYKVADAIRTNISYLKSEMNNIN